MIIAGATGAGKTTMLRALASEIPPDERIITIETELELGLDRFPELHPDVVALEAREANVEGVGRVSAAELVRMSLRMNPDRVIVGEVRGDEVIPMLNAMSQGNDGSMCTVHADSSATVFNKLALYAHAGAGAPSAGGNESPRRGGARPRRVHREDADRAVRLLGPPSRRCRWRTSRHERAVPSRCRRTGRPRRTASRMTLPQISSRTATNRRISSERRGDDVRDLQSCSVLGIASGLLLDVVRTARRRADALGDRGAPLAPVRHARRLVPRSERSSFLRSLAGPLRRSRARRSGWFSPDLLEGRSVRRSSTARTEAIAAWAEMLRDTIAAAHGLEAAITATAPLAPAAIREPVAGLAYDIHHQPLHVALGRFAAELDDPIGDLVVAALQAGARGGVRELTDLLGALAEAARDEAAMRLRVEAGRARIRTAVRVIAACTAGMAIGLVVLNPSYVEVYATASGQLMLALIALCWGFALWWLAGMSRFVRPSRFLLPADQEATR